MNISFLYTQLREDLNGIIEFNTVELDLFIFGDFFREKVDERCAFFTGLIPNLVVRILIGKNYQLKILGGIYFIAYCMYFLKKKNIFIDLSGAL